MQCNATRCPGIQRPPSSAASLHSKPTCAAAKCLAQPTSRSQNQAIASQMSSAPKSTTTSPRSRRRSPDLPDHIAGHSCPCSVQQGVPDSAMTGTQTNICIAGTAQLWSCISVCCCSERCCTTTHGSQTDHQVIYAGSRVTLLAGPDHNLLHTASSRLQGNILTNLCITCAAPLHRWPALPACPLQPPGGPLRRSGGAAHRWCSCPGPPHCI